jgi:putative transposon-encoded protein
MKRLKKTTWRKPRDAVVGFVAVGQQVGNSIIPKPAIPPEYIGRKFLIIPLPVDETEEYEVINNEG